MNEAKSSKKKLNMSEKWIQFSGSGQHMVRILGWGDCWLVGHSGFENLIAEQEQMDVLVANLTVGKYRICRKPAFMSMNWRKKNDNVPTKHVFEALWCFFSNDYEKTEKLIKLSSFITNLLRAEFPSSLIRLKSSTGRVCPPGVLVCPLAVPGLARLQLLEVKSHVCRDG